MYGDPRVMQQMGESCAKSNKQFAFEVEYSISRYLYSLAFVAAEKVAFSATQLAGVKLAFAKPLFPEGYQGTVGRACDRVLDYGIVGVKIAGYKIAIITLCGGHEAEATLNLAHQVKIGGHIFNALGIGNYYNQVAGQVAFQNGYAKCLWKQGVNLYGHGRTGWKIKHKSVAATFNAKLTALGVKIHSVCILFKLSEHHKA